MHREKLLDLLREGSGLVSEALERLGSTQRKLERAPDAVREELEQVISAVERASIETADASSELDSIKQDLAGESSSLEMIEDRLFALRDMARKHRVAVDELPELLQRTNDDIAAINLSADALDGLERAVHEAGAHYFELTDDLSKRRAKAGKKLAQAVQNELPPLKLDRAEIRVRLEELEKEQAGAEGAERVIFEVRTNPGQAFGVISKIASGGELSRLMLALKVVLAKTESTGTMIFDEVDAGIGGATADAVGERLARLAGERQILVVTHAPQVAARANHHISVSKQAKGAKTHVDVIELEGTARQDEVARMLAGAEITDAARAAAQSLMTASG